MARITVGALAGVGSSVETGELADGAVTEAKLATDCVTGAKIADDAVDSEHIAAGAIDTEHVGDAQITPAKLASGGATAGHVATAQEDGSVAFAEASGGGGGALLLATFSNAFVTGDAYTYFRMTTGMRTGRSAIVFSFIGGTTAIAGETLTLKLQHEPGTGWEDEETTTQAVTLAEGAYAASFDVPETESSVWRLVVSHPGGPDSGRCYGVVTME